MAKFTENELNWIKNFNAEQNDDAAVIECGKLALRIVKRSDCLFECEAGGGNLSSHGEGGTMKEALENALKDQQKRNIYFLIEEGYNIKITQTDKVEVDEIKVIKR